MSQKLNHSNISSRIGFTLTEVLIALAIFTIGFIAVASIFPAGVLLQRRTVEDLDAVRFKESASTLVINRGFDGGMTGLGALSDYLVQGRPAVQPHPTLQSDWALSDRQFPSSGASSMYWTPLFLDVDPSPASQKWQVYLFFTRHQGFTYEQLANHGSMSYRWAVPQPAALSYNSQPQPPSDPDPDYEYGLDSNLGDPYFVPGIANIAVTASGSTISFDNEIEPTLDNGPGDSRPLVRIGDRVLDNLGIIHRVVSISTTGIEVGGDVQSAIDVREIWFAHPGFVDRDGDRSIDDYDTLGDRSSFVDLVLLVDGGSDSSLIRLP